MENAHYRIEEPLQVNQLLKQFESTLYPQKEIMSKLDIILESPQKNNYELKAIIWIQLT